MISGTCSGGRLRALITAFTASFLGLLLWCGLAAPQAEAAKGRSIVACSKAAPPKIYKTKFVKSASKCRTPTYLSFTWRRARRGDLVGCVKRAKPGKGRVKLARRGK